MNCMIDNDALCGNCNQRKGTHHYKNYNCPLGDGWGNTYFTPKTDEPPAGDMIQPTVLSADEMEIITKYREKKRRLNLARQVTFHRAKAVSGFYEWSIKNANTIYGTFDQFCDDYGYENMEGEDKTDSYRTIIKAINAISSNVVID